MNQEKFSEKEALGVIEEMVNKSLYKIQEGARYFLLWGWMVFIAALAHFLSLQMGIYNGWIVWPVLMTIALIAYFVMAYKHEGGRKANTYIDRVNKYLWLGMLGPLLITIILGIQFGWVMAYPVFMAIYGWSVITAGGLLKFKPLVWGGILSYLFGVITFFVPETYILVMLALAVLAGYIIPGHALSRAES